MKIVFRVFVAAVGFLPGLAFAVEPVAPAPPFADAVAAEPGACETPRLLAAGKGGDQLFATCTVACPSGNISCTGTTCSAVDRNCAIGEAGRVTCGGSTTSCTACACTNGTTRIRETSVCCCNYDDPDHPVKRRQLVQDTCVNGAWTSTIVLGCNGASCTTTKQCFL